jgi:long-chain acyl-CoA synthetase
MAGELWIRGPHVMTGYHHDPESTAAELIDGWLRTGDRVSRDSDGFYHLAGRIKNVIISGGRNIAPEAVTAVLHQHAAVKEAVTIGLPDADWGERVIAAAVVTDDTGENALIDWCREQLAEYQVPKHIVLLEQLPRGPSGKVQLPLAKALIEAALQPKTHGHRDQDHWAHIVAIASDILRTPAAQLTKETGPDNTAGWDSLAHMALVEALERAFGIALSARDIMSLGCLGDALAMTEARLTESA